VAELHKSFFAVLPVLELIEAPLIVLVEQTRRIPEHDHRQADDDRGNTENDACGCDTTVVG
jgi:hypothetical protein